MRSAGGLTTAPERLLTIREVAGQLGVCTATVYALCSRGALPHVRILNSVRVSPAALQEFVARGGGAGTAGESDP